MKVFINENISVPNSIWDPLSIDDFRENIKNLLESLGCFDFFNESQLYYNSKGINQLIEDLGIANEVNSYNLFDEVAQLRQAIIDLDATDWSENKLHKDDYNYIVQLDAGFTPYNSKNTSIAEATEYLHNDFNVSVLNFKSSEFNTYDIIKVNRVNINPPQDMILYNLGSYFTKEGTIKYYLKNRDKIEYNHNPKHGENHTSTKEHSGKKIVSPLECTQEEAKEFVKLTVGDRKSKDLFFYDESRDKYIRFKYDNTDNPKTYHAFYPHDQDIPDRVKDFLKINIGLFKNE